MFLPIARRPLEPTGQSREVVAGKDEAQWVDGGLRLSIVVLLHQAAPMRRLTAASGRSHEAGRVAAPARHLSVATVLGRDALHKRKWPRALLPGLSVGAVHSRVVTDFATTAPGSLKYGASAYPGTTSAAGSTPSHRHRCRRAGAAAPEPVAERSSGPRMPCLPPRRLAASSGHRVVTIHMAARGSAWRNCARTAAFPLVGGG